jgi:hypothetical protein
MKSVECRVVSVELGSRGLCARDAGAHSRAACVPASSLLEALERMGPGPRGRREVGRVLPVADADLGILPCDAELRRRARSGLDADRRRRDDWNAFLVALALLALALLVVGLWLGAGDRVDANGKALDRADGVLTDVRVRLDAMEAGYQAGKRIEPRMNTDEHGWEDVEEADALFGRGDSGNLEERNTNNKIGE